MLSVECFPGDYGRNFRKLTNRKSVEEKWYQFWLDQKFFVADPAHFQ